MSRVVRLGWSKVKNYAQVLYDDYRTVALDVAAEVRSRPVKACAYAAAGAILAVAYKQNPSEEHFRDALLDCQLRLLLLANGQRSSRSEEQIHRLTVLLNKRALRFLDFFCFTVVLRCDAPADCDLYRCGHPVSVWPRMFAVYAELVDWGAFGTWFRLEKAMRNYDHNTDE